MASGILNLVSNSSSAQTFWSFEIENWHSGVASRPTGFLPSMEQSIFDTRSRTSTVTYGPSLLELSRYLKFSDGFESRYHVFNSQCSPKRNQVVEHYISLKAKVALDFKIENIHAKT
jgi:hypothetical protein